MPQSIRSRDGELSETVLRARWVAPMEGPILHDGAVAIRGETIVGVGHWAEIRKSFASGVVTDYGDAVVLPGLVMCMSIWN